MSVRRGVWAWLTNWRNGATLAVTVIAVTVLFVVVDSSRGRDRALDALERQTRQQSDDRAASTRRIDMLQARIDELVDRGEANNVLLGLLVGEVEALRSQVRSLGAEPVVGEPAVGSRTPVLPGPGESRPPASPTPTPGPTSSPAPAPSSPPPSRPPDAPPPPPAAPTSTTVAPRPEAPAPLLDPLCPVLGVLGLCR